MTRVPDVSVVIPTRDRWRLLSTHALPSALAQEDVEIEVIVVDDGSSDGTPDRLAARPDPRVRVIARRESSGPSAARNAGVSAARAGWVAFLDDDDRWAPRKLRAQLDRAAATGAGWVYAGTVLVGEQGEVLAVPVLPDPASLRATLQRGNRVWGGPSAVLVRTELVRRLGGFDEQLRCFEDWDLWLRLAAVAPAAAVADVLVAHLEHADSTLFRSPVDVREQHERMLSKHRVVTRRDRIAVLEWLAAEHVRAGRNVRAARLYLTAALRYRSAGNLVAGVGALFGARGLRAAASLHRVVRGRSHLRADERRAHPGDLGWLRASNPTAG